MWNTTNKRPRTSRLPVDNQPTSFEDNSQFKLFHRLIEIPSNEQVVFKFSSANPVNIMERKINLWQGGREYLVIPDQGQYSSVDPLLSVIPSTNVNGNLLDRNITEHPATGVTIQYGLLTGADQIVIDPTDQFPNGDAVQTGGNVNRANSVLLTSPNKSGVAAGQAFYLVFNSINNSATSGHFYLQWEERFPE